MVTILCLILGLGLVGLGCLSRANTLKKQEQYPYMKWVAYDTIGTLALSLSIVLTGLGMLVVVGTLLPF